MNLLSHEGQKSDFEKTKDELLKSRQLEKNLLEENQNIGDLKRYLLEVNNFKINYKGFKKPE